MVRFFRKVLKNGMTVLFEKRENEVVSIAFAIRYGSINEDPKEKGIAHFIEHLLYKGTPNRTSKQISEEIEKRGGVLNGFTSEQMTAYWCKLPSKHLKTGLEVLGDIVRNPLFDELEIEKERKVIFEEMNLYKDAPHLHVHDKIMSYLFKGTLGLSTIGTQKTLLGINKIKMHKKFEQVYATDNLILCVVGDANFNEICKFAEETFPKTKSKVPHYKILLNNQKGIEKRNGIDQANLVFSYHVPTALKKEHNAAYVLNALMAGGMSSRLFSEIREKRNLAYAVKGACNCDKDFGYNSIYVGTTKKNVGLVRRLIIEEFKKIKDLKEKELDEIKEQLIGNHKIGQEDSQGQMLDLLYSELFGNAKKAYEYEKNIRAVKLSEVKKLANFNDYSFFALVPQ